MNDTIVKKLLSMGFVEHINDRTGDMKVFRIDFDNKLLFTVIYFEARVFKNNFVDVKAFCFLPHFTGPDYKFIIQDINLFSGFICSKQFLDSLVDNIGLSKGIRDTGISYCKYLGDNRFLDKRIYKYDPMTVSQFLQYVYCERYDYGLVS